jgi:hypothetical protein
MKVEIMINVSIIENGNALGRIKAFVNSSFSIGLKALIDKTKGLIKIEPIVR